MRDDDFVMALGRHGAPHAGLTRLIPVAGKGVPPRSGRRPPRGANHAPARGQIDRPTRCDYGTSAGDAGSAG